ncbi:uncharacterized protein LOC117646567 [Thrips palmi]|uniref:Uncharacterized protein LOC117646567 n=1 Tax=Thrips palmi TaxID=161013 RepID=A0A6P8ZP52_THRPL|nr:uncharacterized protein LOC117646567 [Thrips palmi]
MPPGRTSAASQLASLVVFIAALVVAESRAPATVKKLVPVYYDVGVCSDKPHYTEIQNLTITMDERGAHYVNSAVLLTKEMKSVSKLLVHLTKCTGGKATNLCEYYLRWVWTTGLCHLIPARGMLWSPFYDAFEPPFSCPMKGHYFVRNATLDVDNLKGLFPDMHRHIWPAEFQVYNENADLIGCILFTVEFRYVKGKA